MCVGVPWRPEGMLILLVWGRGAGGELIPPTPQPCPSLASPAESRGHRLRCLWGELWPKGMHRELLCMWGLQGST